MNETGKRAGKLSRQVAGLQSSVVKLCGWRRDNELVPNVDLELIAMVLALNATEADDYSPSSVLDCYRMQVKISDEKASGLLKQCEYYGRFTRRQIIEEAVERILYVFMKGENPKVGEDCERLELTGDVNSNEYQKERQILNTLPDFIPSMMGYRQDTLGIGGKDCEYVGVDGEEDVNTDLNEDELAEPEFVEGGEPEEYIEEKPEKERPMRFHWFWSHIALPLSAITSAIFVVTGILAIAREGMIMIVDILLNAGWFVFGIPALKGLYKFTSDGYDANNKLLIYLIGVRGVCGILLMLLTGFSNVMNYLPDLIWAFSGILIKVYYKKRKSSFTGK